MYRDVALTPLVQPFPHCYPVGLNVVPLFHGMQYLPQLPLSIALCTSNSVPPLTPFPRLWINASINYNGPRAFGTLSDMTFHDYPL